MDATQLHQLLTHGLAITTRMISFLAKVWSALEQRGEDMSSYRNGLMRYLPLIDQGKMDPAILIQFAGQALLLRELAMIPLDEQRRLASGEKVALVTQLDDGSFSTKMVDIASLHARYYSQIFDMGRVRTEKEQKKLLDTPARVIKRQQKIRKKMVLVDKEKGAIKCGSLAILLDDLYGALSRSSGKTPNEIASFLGLEPHK